MIATGRPHRLGAFFIVASGLPRSAFAAACALTLTGVLAGCAQTSSTSSFKGESHAVAQVIADFQSHASTGDAKSICEQDFSSTLKAKLAKGLGCKKALEEQFHEVDNFNVTIESVAVNGLRASAKVKSTVAGKLKLGSLSLIKEGKHWKISGASE